MPLINYLTKVHFSDNVLETALGVELEILNSRRPLVTTDDGIAAYGLLDRLLEVLPATVKPVIFKKNPGVPTDLDCFEAVRIFNSEDCDCIVGYGGGSVLDMAKAVSLAVTHEGPLIKYIATEGGITRVKDVLIPVIAIPTTAGSGSEVSQFANLVVHGVGPVSLSSPYLSPKVAICDPLLTLNSPPGTTAGNGMDALTHCIESYIATAYDPTSDGIAIDGMVRASANIEKAVYKGQDLDARREMMASALHGALAQAKGLGGAHAMSFALGGLSRNYLDHGTLNAVLLPYVLEFNEPAVGKKYDAIKTALGLPRQANIASEIEKLNKKIGIPSDLKSMGIDLSAVKSAASVAEKDLATGTNPRRASASDYLSMMVSAL